MPAIPRRVLLVVLAVATLAACSSSSSGGDATAPATAPAGRSAGSVAPSWPIYHGNRAHSGYAPHMPAVRGSMRTVGSLKLDGAVYASPIVVDGITVVATEHDTVYAFNSSYKQLWKAHLGTPSPQSERPCGNVDPLGVTGTPVYYGGNVYVAAELTKPVRHHLVALNLHTGKITFRRGLDVAGVQTNAMQERGGLTVSGHTVWVPFGGMAGDCGNYKGRLVGIPVTGKGATRSYTVPTAREAGIWTPPGPATDAAGHLFVAVGNGASGVGDPYDHSDSVLKISTKPALLDSYSPRTWPTDNDADKDLGSQGPALVGPWIFQAGKSGTAYVLRQSHLGGIGGQVSSASLCRSFGGTAVVGSTVYVPCTDGVRAVSISSKGHMTVRWHASSSITGSPVVGGGRVWSLDPNSGRLYALDPSTGKVRSSIAVGPTSRFATPALTGRDVVVPTLAGVVAVRTS